MSEEERSRETRARAETALVRLLYELREDDPFLVVLGGLVPEVLTRNDASAVPEHLGTTDVDLLLITRLDPERDLGAVERALERMAFGADVTQDGWRWRGAIDGFPVLLEFLCDLEGYPEKESIRPPGCRVLAAANLRGTGYVASDFEWENLRGNLADGASVTVRARFASLQGYLLSKCVAVRTRAAIKDYYDLVYVLEHNREGGPEQAARKLRDGKFLARWVRSKARCSRFASAITRPKTSDQRAMPSRLCWSIPRPCRQSYAPTRSMSFSVSLRRSRLERD